MDCTVCKCSTRWLTHQCTRSSALRHPSRHVIRGAVHAVMCHLCAALPRSTRNNLPHCDLKPHSPPAHGRLGSKVDCSARVVETRGQPCSEGAVPSRADRHRGGAVAAGTVPELAFRTKSCTTGCVERSRRQRTRPPQLPDSRQSALPTANGLPATGAHGGMAQLQ